MEGAKIQISTKLLEKLAGNSKRQQAPRRQGRGAPASGGPGGGPPLLGGGLLPQLGLRDLGGGLALEPELRGALATSRRVGGLLLKAEAREAAAITAAADELLGSKAAAPARRVPCGAERVATAECYTRNATEAWKCSGLVDAYAACSAAACDQLAA